MQESRGEIADLWTRIFVEVAERMYWGGGGGLAIGSQGKEAKIKPRLCTSYRGCQLPLIA